jgi:hypothetical protein
MWTHCVRPTESLTWDDVCQLWDNGVYTAQDIKNIAPLYFEGPELSAVLEVVEKVENDSRRRLVLPERHQEAGGAEEIVRLAR